GAQDVPEVIVESSSEGFSFHGNRIAPGASGALAGRATIPECWSLLLPGWPSGTPKRPCICIPYWYDYHMARKHRQSEASVVVWLPVAEKSRLVRDAKAAGRSASAYLREAAGVLAEVTAERDELKKQVQDYSVAVRHLSELAAKKGGAKR